MKEAEIPEPSSTESHLLTSTQVNQGPSVPKLQRLQLMDADSWEDMTLELVAHWKSIYTHVVRCGGGGDMGRDVIAYSSDEADGWENFQCKHYAKSLNLNQALLEIGKLLYYVQQGHFSYPKNYFFVSPQGVSTDLLNHLMNSEKLKTALKSRWDKVCRSKITSTKSIALEGEIEKFIDAQDFSIFDHIPAIKIIELHSQTTYHVARFGNAAPLRPRPEVPPEVPDASEMSYIEELLRAFSDVDGKIYDLENINEKGEYKKELDSARINYYSAENLQRFSRDWLPDTEFGELLDECYESISPVVNSPHENGYYRYLETSKHAVLMSYDSHPLTNYLKQRDKKGFCHQLANSGQIKWVKCE